MIITHDFDYLKPKTTEALIELLSTHEKTAILAGGTDIICNIKEGLVKPNFLIDIKGLKHFSEIELVGNELKIGALVTFSQLIDSDIIKEKYPLLFQASKLVASMGIRNRATIAGNICSAVPCMDCGAPLSAYEAYIHTISKDGIRKISIDDWFIAPRKTAIKSNEFVTHITINMEKHVGVYSKLGRYQGEDLAQATVAIACSKGKKYRISFGSVGPVPIKAKQIEQLLEGKDITDSLIKEAKAIIEGIIFPITDIRSTKEYRMHMSKVMFERGLKTIHNDFKGFYW